MDLDKLTTGTARVHGNEPVEAGRSTAPRKLSLPVFARNGAVVVNGEPMSPDEVQTPAIENTSAQPVAGATMEGSTSSANATGTTVEGAPAGLAATLSDNAEAVSDRLIAPPPSAPSEGYIPHLNRVKQVEQSAWQMAVQERVVNAIRLVYDPEIPINIYDLGLIYDIEVDAECRVNVRMTLTAPGCPVAGILPGQVERRIESLPEVRSATVELVWEPSWSRDMMSEIAKLELGMF
jgi:FeS assembly SUF system protein